MKPSTLLFAGSLAANAAVAAVLLLSPSGARSFSAPDKTRTHSTGAQASPANVKKAPAMWTRLQTEDSAQFVARLKAAGFPMAAIRVLINERLRAQFADRRKAILGESAAFEYWKTSGTFNSAYAVDPKVRAALRDLSREQKEAAKALLGPDATEEDVNVDALRRQYGTMSKEKRDQVSLIAQDYTDLTAQVRSAANGIMLPADREKLAYLEEEKRRDLLNVLTPEELADYEMHSSPTTSNIRFRLQTLDLTEDQFRTIYQFQKQVDDKYSPVAVGYTSADFTKARAEAQKQAAASIKAALGEPLGTEYERAMDQNYQAANAVVLRLNLPKEAVQQVLDVKKDIEQRATALRADTSLAREERTAQLTALSNEAQDRLTTALGQKGLGAYKDSGGFWLSNLVPPATR
jgi:hypothetical protein